MDFRPLVQALGHSSLLTVRSDDILAGKVHAEAKAQAQRNDVYAYGKTPTPISMSKPLLTSPAQVLHELGVATTLITASPMAQVARHWAHVRYCATLTDHRRHLALTRQAEDVVYHHAMTQSEQLGIGLALLVAKAVLHEQHPGWDFQAVDAEVALKAGFIDGVGNIDQATGTKKRPDYFLVGRRIHGRRAKFKVVVLECKGTHGTQTFAIEQLARATTQVESVRVGGRTPSSLMVASRLSRTGIVSYVLDPEGDDDLWSANNKDVDEFLSAKPLDEGWYARPAPPPPPFAPPTDESSAPTLFEEFPPEVMPQSDLQIFDIPEERRGWFTQILARTAAATTLLFAGNSAAAREYATQRQRGEATPAQPPLFDMDSPWAHSTARSLRLPNGLRLEGTAFQTPLPDGTLLEVFRGVEARLYRLLADGKIGPYLRAAPRFHNKWTRTARPPGTALSLGRDGTVLVIRRTSGR